jgi:hypothetical protein
VVSFFPVTRLLELRGTQWVTQRMGFHLPITNDYLDVWDECCCCCPHNPLHLSGRPSIQRIRCVTRDLSTNGVTPCRQFPWRNQLCVIISFLWTNEQVTRRKTQTRNRLWEKRSMCVVHGCPARPLLRHVTGGGWAAKPDTDIFVCVAQECNLLTYKPRNLSHMLEGNGTLGIYLERSFVSWGYTLRDL